jgi:sec-independent protein translocase protein TatC
MIVLLNFAGMLTGARLGSWWRWIIFIVFIFAAVATPTGDPINLLLLAGPILVLVIIAILVSLANDRRRAKRRPKSEDFSELNDDEASTIDGLDELSSVDELDPVVELDPLDELDPIDALDPVVELDPEKPIEPGDLKP